MWLSRVRLFATLWTVVYQVPPSMGFSRQEYWRGLPFLSPDLPNPGIEPRSPALYADALPSEPPGKFVFGKYFCCMTRINAAFHPKIELSWSILWSFGHLFVLSHFSCVWLFTILWTVPTRLLCLWDSSGKKTGLMPSSRGHVLLQGIFPDTGIKPMSLMCPALAGGFFTTSTTWETCPHM